MASVLLWLGALIAAVIPLTGATESATHCPVSLLGTKCPSGGFAWYYKCCGDMNKDCCMQLETWALIVAGVILLFVALSILLCIVRFVCSCCRRATY